MKIIMLLVGCFLRLIIEEPATGGGAYLFGRKDNCKAKRRIKRYRKNIFRDALYKVVLTFP